MLEASGKQVVLINLVPVTSGGGLQNALSFLEGLASRPRLRDRSLIACTRDTPLHRSCSELGLSHVAIPPGLAGRVAYEVALGRSIARTAGARILFTLFGNAPWRHGNVHTISGFAYSYVIQREVQFWNFLPFFPRIWRKLKDFGRLQLARRADELILETDYLRERAEIGVFRGKTLHVVRMEPSLLVAGPVPLPQREPAEPRHLLCLATPHPNKRIDLLAPVLVEMNAISTKTGGPAVYLVTTMPENAPYLGQIRRSFARAGASALLVNVGPIAPANVRSLLSSVDAIANVALLESFSNNWVEAWSSGRPLITTDAEWSRRSCGAAAIYVDPTRPMEAAQEMLKAFSPVDRDRLILAGQSNLRDLASAGPKIDQYAGIILNALATP